MKNMGRMKVLQDKAFYALLQQLHIKIDQEGMLFFASLRGVNMGCFVVVAYACERSA